MFTKQLVICLFLIYLSVSGPVAAISCPACLALCAFAGPAYLACLATCCGMSSVTCFDQNSTFQTGHQIVTATQVSPGIKLLTLKNGQQIQTEVLGVVKTPGFHDFVKIYTSNNSLTVTVDHLMLVEDKLLKAQNLKLGMMLGQQKIEKLELLRKENKVTIIVSEGTLLANGIVTSTICGEYEGMSVQEGLKKWRQDHKLIVQ